MAESAGRGCMPMLIKSALYARRTFPGALSRPEWVSAPALRLARFKAAVRHDGQISSDILNDQLLRGLKATNVRTIIELFGKGAMCARSPVPGW